MGAWIALLVILMLIGTVSWAMPSPRDKALAAMRSQAIRLGMRVRLVDKTLAGALFPWLEYFQGYVLYEKAMPLRDKNKNRDIKVFRLQTNEGRAKAKDSCHEIVELLGVMSGLEELPTLISAVVVSSTSLSLLWREQGDVENVEKVNCCLEQLNQKDEFWRLVTL